MPKITKTHNTILSLLKSVSAEFAFFHRKITYSDELKTIIYVLQYLKIWSIRSHFWH